MARRAHGGHQVKAESPSIKESVQLLKVQMLSKLWGFQACLSPYYISRCRLWDCLAWHFLV